MQEHFNRFLQKILDLQSADPSVSSQNPKVLLAISGGMDSVVMAHLFHQSVYQFGLAHCNFQLRSEASDQDEVFVKNLAKEMKVPFISTQFNTKKIAVKRKTSIQVTARELRVEWLETIRQEKQYTHIATAHHLNDSVETILYNFAKGTGIRGLTGIPIVNGFFIRPLLFATKNDIRAFAQKQQISYHEDASNATDQYNRNRIRHHVIPVLQQINPALESTVQKNIEHLKETAALFNWAVEKIKKEIVKVKDNEHQIDIKKLSQFPSNTTLLFELLHPFGFNLSQIEQALQTQETNSGRQFYSATHRLIIDRNTWHIQPIDSSQKNEIFLIETEQSELITGTCTFVLNHENSLPTTFPDDPNIAFINADKLTYPLRLRHWQTGDMFQPLGMNGQHQKLQDYFSNQKLSISEKEKVWILESEGEICWVAGYRLDERFKVTSATRLILRMEMR